MPTKDDTKETPVEPKDQETGADKSTPASPGPNTATDKGQPRRFYNPELDTVVEADSFDEANDKVAALKKQEKSNG
jgi:hypothetical protein